ncbi:hypothetical protein ITP53_35925 [Nonomuraea sp. K274]|uniref:Signal transduction histidine kinase subgroup 3 dimerisation and phosphoacceptor domain-containing protein n=1 Tax=Nonomuraea cypriaca TaxID=1187855 RepID=A0A931AE02_9ACTN|nr:histidine kinase [Nonomuraea cypriaca]MBF8191006.1 hypothetical protein [Nonomuraea cypriaca]
MDPLKRARRFTGLLLVSSIALMWFLIASALVTALREDELNWWRTVPALIAAIGFTWLCPLIFDAVLDRRYPTRQVVVAAVLALLAAGLGGADPIGWGFLLSSWLALATLGVRRRTAVLQAVGTWVAGVGLGGLSLASGWTVMDVGVDRPLVSYGVMYAFLCTFLPLTNKMWIWIWELAVQAHEGREAHTRLAVAEERLRFARDLHDLVGHRLSAIAVKTQLAVRLSDVDTEAAKAEMAEVNTLTRTALRELRQAVRGYRELDLTAELNGVKGVLEAAGVRCEVRVPYRELPGGVAPVFAYTVREAVTNVLKHSAATFCDITIRFAEQRAELIVRNDGVIQRQAMDPGTGLTGMEERLAAVDGTVSAHSTDDGQFVLNAVVSLPIRG